jgi:hypothetical protein
MIAASEHESFDPSEAEEEAFGDEFCDIQWQIDKQIGTSVLALAAVLIGAVKSNDAEPLRGLNRASLAAIRPQLVGAIAEDADRVLASANAA